jgi:hypothetical protein
MATVENATLEEHSVPRRLPRRALFGAGAAATATALVGSAVRSPESAFGATAPMTIEAGDSSQTPLVLRGAASQDADLQQWQSNDQTVLARVDKAGQFTTRHINLDTRDQGQNVSPELHYKGANGFWLQGLDWANTPPSRDFTVASKVDYPNPGNVFDFVFCAHRGSSLAPTLAVGNSSLDQSVALATFAGPDDGQGNSIEPTLGGILVRQMVGSTAPAIMVRQGWSNATQFAVQKDGSIELKDANAHRTLFIDGSNGAISSSDANTPVSILNSMLVRAAPGAGNFAPLLTVRQTGDTNDRFRIRSDGTMFWGTGSALDNGTKLSRWAAGVLRAEGKLVAAGGVGVGNSAPASNPGKLSRKVEVFDGEGRSLGYVPIYNSIS